MSTDLAFQRLAVASYLKKAAADVESGLKAELLDVMEPGDRKMATIEGVEVATITRAKLTEVAGFVVTDDVALADWCEANGHSDGVRTVRTVHDWKVAELLRKAGETGEVPDGVTYETRTRGGYISARQTDTQKTNLRTLAADGALSALVTELAQIEGNRNE